jgi:hypothetical protein
VATVLIELPGGEGIVRGEDGEIVLAYDVTLGTGQPLQPWDRYQPLAVALSGDRMLFGGLLPPGAVSVEAVEATGVRKAAAFVHRPMPAEYPYHPVADADEPCPVCRAVRYGEYLPTEGWRAGGGTKGTDTFVPSPLVVCGVCGHEERASVILRLGQPDTADEDEAARAVRLARFRAEYAARRWRSDKITLTAVTFPVYAADGWPARITGSGSQNDDLTHLVIGHAEPLPDPTVVQRPRIEITTSIDPYQPGELAVARATFARGSDADANRKPADGLSDAALTLRNRAAHRRRIAGSHQAPVRDTEITIDGAREPFVTVGTPNAHWVAVRRHHDVTITIVAREVDPTSLIIEPIADPEARLLGPEPDPP